jgi:hypothetical protein
VTAGRESIGEGSEGLGAETPVKVLVIMGSPRKGNTYRAAERIGIRRIIFDLGYSLNFSSGCKHLFRGGRYPESDPETNNEKVIQDSCYES